MEINDYQIQNFLLPITPAINRSDFFSIFLETNPDLGIIIIGLDSSLPLNSHNKILILLQETADQYFNTKDLDNESAIFENILGQFNENFSKILGEQISWTRKINVTIALLLNTQLHFANYGHNHFLLIKPKHYVDIIKSMSVDVQVPGNKLFSQIYSGSVEKFSRIALCNPASFDYVSSDKIKSIFSLLPLQNIGEQINQLTENIKKNQIISGTLVQLQAAPQVNINQVLDSDKPSQNSIDLLLKTSEKTSKLLRPQLLPDLNKLFKALKKVSFLKNKSAELKEKNVASKPFYKKVDLSKYSLASLGYKTTNLLRRIRHQKNITQVVFKNFPANLRYLLKNLKFKFKSLPKSSKYLLFIALFLLTILSVNLIFLGFKKHTQSKSEYYNSIVSQINSQHDEARAAIIYGDNKTARQILKTSKNLIFNLPKNNDERQATYEKLTSVNNELLAEANHVQNISSPFLFIELEKFDSEIKAEKIILIKNKLIILSPSKLLTIDTLDNEVVSHNLTDYNIESSRSMITTQGLIIIYTKTGEIFRFDPINNSFASTDTNLSIKNDDLVTIKNYNNRLYILDKNNQIWRRDPQGINFGTARGWLKENVNLSKAVDMAIDGNIFILNNDGSIIKLKSGNVEKFNIENIEPNLTNATHIYTNTNIPYLYFIDPTNQRLIVYDNEGKLVKQYQSNKFSNLKDFAIDYKAENDKSIVYLLSDNNIYQVVIDE